MYVGTYGIHPRVTTLNIVYLVYSWSGELQAKDDVASLKWFDVRKTPKKLGFPYLRGVLTDTKKALTK